MFILTPGASFDYEPSAKFIDYVQGSIKSKIQLVVCLDQLIDSSLSDIGVAPTLYIHDSKRSAQNNIRDAFVANLKNELRGNSEIISKVVEVGVYEIEQDDENASDSRQE